MVKIFNSSDSPPSNAENIMVAGGGLAGLSTALGLAQLGYHVDVIECRKVWLQQGSAFGLAANGRKALKELFPSQEHLRKLIEKGIHSERTDSHLLVWYMVRDALLEEVKKYSSISIHMGKTIESYDDTSNPSQIEVLVRDVENDRKEKLKGCLLVAADGVYSNIRQLVGLEPAKFATKTKWRGTIPHVPKGSILEPLLDRGIAPLYADESTSGMTIGECILNLFNFHPKIDRMMTLTMSASVTGVPHGTHPREIFHESTRDPYHQQILEEVYQLAGDSEMYYPLAMAVIELPKDGSNGWGGNGRVLFVGDAAHACRPASGLGGSLAFEDAVVLCRLLKSGGSGTLKTRASAEAFVRTFETSRFDRVKAIWDNQWEISESVYKKGSNLSSLDWTPAFAAWVRQGV